MDIQKKDLDEIKTTKTIKTTERYQDIKKFLKYSFFLIIFSIVLYCCYIAFGFYIFGSFFISLFFSIGFFFRLSTIKYEYYIESRIEFLPDNKRNYILNEFKIPQTMIKDFTFSGESTIKFMSRSGKSKSIVRKIDLENKHIEYHWFSEISDWEFLISQKTFDNLSEMLKECYSEITKNKIAREIYQSKEFVKTMDFTEKDIDTRDFINNELILKLNNLFKDKDKDKEGNNNV